MSQLVQLTTRANDIAELFKKNRDRMTRGAPKGLDPGRLMATAFNAIAYNSDLLNCTRESLIGGTFEAMKLGLTLGGPMQEAWLIPFKGRKKDGDQWRDVYEATLVVGYMGYRNLIDRARSTIDLHPRAVHNGKIAKFTFEKDRYDKEIRKLVGFEDGQADDFTYSYGDEPRIHHHPTQAQPLYQEQLYAVYAVARLRGGGKQMEVMLKDEVDEHRRRSRAANKGPWVDDYVPMAMKTVIRKIAKYLPKASLELSRAIDLDNKADEGTPQDFDVTDFTIETGDAPAKPAQMQPQRLEGLKQTIRAEQPAEKEKVPAKPIQDTDINFG